MRKRKGRETDDELVIPELEKLIDRGYRPWNPWNEREDALLRKYYNRVPVDVLLKYLPGRTTHGCRSRAKQIGVAYKIRDIVRGTSNENRD